MRTLDTSAGRGTVREARRGPRSGGNGRARFLGRVALLWLAMASMVRADRLDFPTRVLPVLTKAGCNSGGCHGAATGQGGFRLSLLGCEPELDHLALTRELGARRIDPAIPAESLFLRKATRRVSHEGGRRFQPDSAEAALLERWVAAGAPYGARELRVVGLEVSPDDVLSGPDQPAIGLRVRAELSDGTREDVTSLALYSSNDEAVAEVDRQGSVTVRGAGSTGIMIRYAGQVALTRVDSPWAGPLDDAAFASFVPENFVDERVLERLRRLRLPPSPRSDGVTFLRRVSLDLAGRLPTPEEVETFLGEADTSAARRRVIDRLLDSDDFVDVWTMRWADLLLISGRRGSEAGARAWHGWLREQVASNRPWNEVVRELLTAEGPVERVGPANFLVLTSDARDLAEHVGSMFLGVQIGCARCHAHPSDRWTQEDHHRFAAYFARVNRDDGRVRDVERGEIEHPRTGRVLTPRPLGGEAKPGDGAVSRRVELAEWLTSPDHRPFARALVNRVWKHLLGRGLVEPVDDLRPTNPASHPELLEALATHFLEHGQDLRDLVRTIVRSRTYQLAPATIPGNETDGRHHSHALLKAPAAQVRLDMIAQATGVAESFGDQPRATRAVQLVGTQTSSYALEVFGRCGRERSCETTAAGGGGLALALHLINGSTLNGRLRTALSEEWVARVGDAEVVRRLYLRTLSRPPRPEELAGWTSRLAMAEVRTEALEDFLWALLNSREFSFIH